LLALLIAVALVLFASTICGSAIWLATVDEPSAISVPVGFAALLMLTGVLIKLPGASVTAAVGASASVAASLTYLRARRRWPSIPPGAGLMVAAVVLIALLPFAASGRVGLLGAGTNDDLADHLLAGWTLEGHLPLASSKLLAAGYPAGPHSLAATIDTLTGVTLPYAFTAVMLVVPALLALAAWVPLRSASPPLRGLVGALVGLCYLQAAYLVQASFKEPIESLLLIGFAAALWQLTRSDESRPLRMVPLAVLAAACVYVSSYLGLLWPACTAALWVATSAILKRRRPSFGRPQTLALAAALGTFLLLIAPELPRMVDFASSAYNRESAIVLGNLLRPLSPLEGLGIWPRPDFRFDLALGSPGGVLTLMALAALAICVMRCVARGELVFPSALLASIAIYLLTSGRAPYTVAKALAIAAPLATWFLGRELLAIRDAHRLRSGWSLALALLAVMLGAGAYSDLKVLRDAPVAPDSHATELARLRSAIGNSPTLFLGADDYIHWELRGANVATPPQPLYTQAVVPLRSTKAQPDTRSPALAGVTLNRFAGLGLGFDFSSIPPRAADRFNFAIVPRSAYTSRAPASWKLVQRTRSYELWRRTASTRPYQSLAEIDNPGAVLNCQTSLGRKISSSRGVASVEPAPVVGERGSWKGRVGYAGRSVHQFLRLQKGDWEISLQYASTVPLKVRAPGLDAVLPASLEPLGPYWYVGTAHLPRTAITPIVVTSSPLPVLGRILGAYGLTRAPAPTGVRPLGRLTATRARLRTSLIPLRQACGRYVDWYRTS
jgi:hypothetical protein